MIISKTPLRMSFFGGGTDFADYYMNSRVGYGNVLSTALNMYVYIMVTKRFDDKLRICYTKNEFVDSVDEIQHNIIREALRIVGIEKGIDVVYSADIPLRSAGIGLASSSALAVGVLNALYTYKGVYASPELLARKACEIEIERLNNPIGIQDQYAVAYGGFRKYTFWDNGEVSSDPVRCDKNVLKSLHDNMLLYYTGLTRISGEILSEQKDNIVDRISILDSMNDMVGEAEDHLHAGDIDAWGEMLDRGWKYKSQMASKITNPQIDDMYRTALSAGATGGKILGAGGGGFLLLYTPKDRQHSVKEAMKEYQAVEFGFEPEGSRIIFIETR